jgi:hypothetical protein
MQGQQKDLRSFPTKVNQSTHIKKYCHRDVYIRPQLGLATNKLTVRLLDVATCKPRAELAGPLNGRSLGQLNAPQNV